MAWFITFACYGTHLRGDEQGSFDHVRCGERRTLQPSAALKRHQKALMTDSPFSLDSVARRDVARDAIVEASAFRGWRLLALHVRTTHVHGIVVADCESGPIVNAWKAYSTRALRKAGLIASDRKVWGHGANAVLLKSNEHVERAMKYVLDSQGHAMATYVAEV
jgi:REP element-mobilizing transposase RayT